MVSEGEERIRTTHTRWLTVPVTEIQNKGRGAYLLGRVTDLVLDSLTRNAFQMQT